MQQSNSTCLSPNVSAHCNRSFISGTIKYFFFVIYKMMLKVILFDK